MGQVDVTLKIKKIKSKSARRYSETRSTESDVSGAYTYWNQWTERYKSSDMIKFTFRLQILGLFAGYDWMILMIFLIQKGT